MWRGVVGCGEQGDRASCKPASDRVSESERVELERRAATVTLPWRERLIVERRASGFLCRRLV